MSTISTSQVSVLSSVEEGMHDEILKLNPKAKKFMESLASYGLIAVPLAEAKDEAEDKEEKEKPEEKDEEKKSEKKDDGDKEEVAPKKKEKKADKPDKDDEEEKPKKKSEKSKDDESDKDEKEEKPEKTPKEPKVEKELEEPEKTSPPPSTDHFGVASAKTTAQPLPVEFHLSETGIEIVNTKTGQSVMLPYSDEENINTVLSGIQKVPNVNQPNMPANASNVVPVGTKISDPSSGGFVSESVAPVKDGKPEDEEEIIKNKKGEKVKADKKLSGIKDDITEAKGKKLGKEVDDKDLDTDIKDTGRVPAPENPVDSDIPPMNDALPPVDGGATPGLENQIPQTPEEKAKSIKDKAIEQLLKSFAELEKTQIKGITGDLKEREKEIKADAGVIEPSVSVPVDEHPLDVQEDVKALTDGEVLSEEFKSKAALIFSAAVNKRLKEGREEQNKLFEAKVAEGVTEATKTIVATCDKYLSRLTKEWLDDNKLAVESGIRNTLTENFIAGLRDLFTKSYVEIPESKLDLCMKLTEQAGKFEQDKVRLGKELKESKETANKIARKLALLESSQSLSLTSREKLAKLAEGVEFKSSESFQKSLKILIESYGLAKTVVKQPASPEGTTIVLTEEMKGNRAESTTGDPLMDAVAKTLEKN